ncbi:MULTISPECIES: hypothetical protein [unclassified Bradyrhizobium]|uniref:hypothetical protein n=1 Tax=Bradyrhizobium sp. USDA 4541 TaxID=2817704 RepID=UPI0020A2D44D|nr:hypothetical protein [Bradyrhizobium sp. USDA 4541]MCP1854223.1 hypothetical protein [Bradyrhizobium sp. USDA 4541]
MSKLRRDRARKRLSEVLSLAHDQSFLVMVWAIDALQSGRVEEARPFMPSFPSEAATAELSSPYFVHKWALETLVNELLVTPKKTVPHKGRTRVLDCTRFETVATCVNILRDLENAEDGITLQHLSVFDIMHKIGHRQFEWQRGFFSYAQIYRALTVYGGELAAQYFKSTNGISIADFFICGFAFSALYQEKPAFDAQVDLSPIQVSSQTRDAALGLFSAPLSEIRKHASAVRRQTIGHSTAYQPSILRKMPMVTIEGSARRVVLAPLRSLIWQRMTAGLYYDLVDGGSDIWREIGSRFENYCLELVEALLPNAKPTGSFKYKLGKTLDSPDLFLHAPDGSAMIVIECKAKKMSIVAKFSDNPLDDAQTAFSEIIKGVVQLWRFFSHCRRNPEIKAIHRDASGVVLTLDPWLQASNHLDRVFAEAHRRADLDRDILDADRRPVLFCSIDDLENTLEIATEASLFEAVDATSRPEFRGWHLVNVHQKVSNVEQHNPYPFSDRIGDIVPTWRLFPDADK